MRSWTRQHLASLRLCSTARQSVRVRPLELLRWFKEQGCTCHDGVEIFEVPGAGWGLRLGPSAVSCAVGARLTTTPKRLVFAADDSRQPKPPLLSGERLPEASRQLRADLVASFLPTLLGREHSAVGPWASAVEAPRSLPLLLVKENGDASDEVRRSSLYHGAVALRRALREEFSAVKSSLQDRCPDARLTDSHLWAAMLWAQALLMSRAAVLPRDGHRLVLAPLADFANHAASFGSANAELLAEKDGSVSLVARKPIVAGEEITHCYAEMDNEQLLFCYGMVLKGNAGSLACPVFFQGSRQALWELVRAELRDETVLTGPPQPLLLPTGKADSVKELLVASRIQHMNETDARLVLQRWRTTHKLLPLLRPHWRDMLWTWRFLDRWLARFPASSQVTCEKGLPREVLQPFLELSEEQRQVVSKARRAVVEQAPWYVGLFMRHFWTIGQ